MLGFSAFDASPCRLQTGPPGLAAAYITGAETPCIELADVGAVKKTSSSQRVEFKKLPIIA